MDKPNYIFFNGSRIKNLQGDRFGMLEAVEPVGIHNRYAVWKCKCDCGNECERSAKYLIDGCATSCGCKTERYRNRGKRSLVGKKFGNLEVISLLSSKKNAKQVYLCKCMLCGETTRVNESNLLTGNTKSCGCLARTDIKGQTFGFLTALEPTEKRQKNSIVWKCKCKCGRTAYVCTSDLKNGFVKSCGCIKELEKTDHISVYQVANKKNKKNNTSGFRGVYLHKGKWCARIGYRGESKWLGRYDRKQDAIAVRLIAERHIAEDFDELMDNLKQKNYIWEQSYEMLQRHIELYGLGDLEQRDAYLYSWLTEQEKSALTKGQIQRLESLGITL